MPRKKESARVVLYKKVFNTPDGKKVLEDMMVTHHMFTTMMAEKPDTLIFNEGERNVVLRILTLVSYPHKEMLKLMEEEAEIE